MAGQRDGRRSQGGRRYRDPRNAPLATRRGASAGGAGPALIRVLDRYLSHGGLPALPFCAITHAITHNPPRRHHAHAYPTHSDSFCPPPAVACCRPTSSSAGPRLFVILSARSCPSRLPPARGSAGAPHHTLPAPCPALRTSTSRYVLHNRLVPLYSRACTLGPIYGGMRRDACTGMHDGWRGKGALRRGARRCHATPRHASGGGSRVTLGLGSTPVRHAKLHRYFNAPASAPRLPPPFLPPSPAQRTDTAPQSRTLTRLSDFTGPRCEYQLILQHGYLIRIAASIHRLASPHKIHAIGPIVHK